MNLFTIVIQIRRILKLFDQLPKILVSHISNGKPWLLFLVLTIGHESQKGSQPLTWSSHIISLFLIDDFPLVQTINLRRYFQDGVLLTVIDLPVFPTIAPSTNFHVHRCELLLPEFLPSGATMINIWWWCYNC